MSKDSSKNASQAYLAKLAVQTQLARLRREEDEDLWISGEELYTEGSSDEEDSRQKSRYPRLRNHLRPGSSSPRRNDMVQTNSSRLNEQFSTDFKAKSDGSDMASGSKLEDKLKEETPAARLLDSASKLFPKESDRLGMSLESDDANLSSNENSTLNLGSDENDEREPDMEISWKPRRVEGHRSLIFEEAVAGLRELQLDYNNVSDSVLKLRECLSSRENEPERILSIETIINGNPDELFPVREYQSRNTKCLGDCNADESVERKETNIMRMNELDESINELEKRIEKEVTDTLYCQRQNRKELGKLLLLRSPETGRLLKNTEAFFQLCPGIKNVTSENANHPRLPEVSTINNMNTHESTFVKFATEKQQLKKKLSMLERKNVIFTERNKRLAACSMGSLAITDEEKQRLENLLIIEPDDTKKNSESINCDKKCRTNDNPYSLDANAIRQLKELDEKLAHINPRKFKLSQNIKCGKHECLEHKLDCINHSLQTLAESKSKEILPISENEIRKLIEEYHAESNNKDQTLQHVAEIIVSPTENVETKSNESTIPSFSSVSTIDTVGDISQDIINELIKEAQISMPLFQLRYQPNIASEY
ncbi:uncharacterized protein LOC107265873 [Cephus cinctus]|uniref:Uncharacterized protein LOC107265873 n=1 Tax=Cephus cinctus TaxID=211228 RepID=A0AAJ7BPI9_CEPCN|nr:uncharacterized protein LOC107265873 [Cephus cinctus]